MDTPFHNRLFEASYRRVFGAGFALDARADAFFADFYRRFLLDERAAAAFAHTDMERQRGMLRRSLFLLVGASTLSEPPSELHRLAHLHQRLGLEAALFDSWLQAIIDTAAAADPHWDYPTELAWRLAFAPGITLFKLAANGLLDPDPGTPRKPR